MPAGRPESGGASGGPSGPNGAGRTSFRPPWVKDGPMALPMPAAPWTLNKRGKESTESQQEPEGPPPPAPRKTSSVKIVPIQPSENGSVKDPHTFERPKLREVPKPGPKETTKLQSKEVKVPITLTRRESKDVPIQVHIESKKTTEPAIPKVDLKPVNREAPREPAKKNIRMENEPIDKAVPSERNAIVRQESMKKLYPAPPPMPPPPPPPPAMPFEKRESLTRSQLEKIDSLRARPRKRPDWAAMMKEVESGRKLKHVECNDRSQPLLPENKVKEQFIYESEKANLHNQLLKQIQGGRCLKHVKTNDRSKPILQGLRKFRRQMTIEEQIQKSQSMANMPEAEVEEEADEMDDIDKVRDDLQSTKQMLALELRNKEAQIRENKRLQARLLNLEAELEKERQLAKSTPQDNTGPSSPVDDKVLKTFKDEAVEAKKTAEALEKKYHDTADQLDVVKTDLDEARRQNQLLEKKLQQAVQGVGPKRQSVSDRRESVPGKEPPPPEEESEEESETESESGGEDNEEKQKRRAEREIRLLGNKLKSYKNKEEAARRERKNLRDQMKKNQQQMKTEKKRYRDLQKEVNKMAALMKDDEEDEEDDEEKEESEVEEETESEESESESESSDEEESSESEDEGTPMDEQKNSLQTRVKRHENCLNALKKGNYMLKANVDRLQDDLNKQKEMVLSLQEDLDSVLAELG